MAINLTTKFSGKVDEVINNGALSTPSINNDYDFVGAQTVKVYSFDTVPLVDYTRSGTNRYGDPSELQANVQELQMEQDKGFAFTIDKGNALDTEPGVREAGKQLRRQTDQEIIPMLDLYRFTKIATSAGHKFYASTALTTSTAYAAFLAANEAIDDEDVPSAGRICNASPAFLNLIKQDSNFIKSGDLSQKTLFNGQVGEIDGVAINAIFHLIGQREGCCCQSKSTTSLDGKATFIIILHLQSINNVCFGLTSGNCIEGSLSCKILKGTISQNGI
jgi:hypothetical protein